MAAEECRWRVHPLRESYRATLLILFILIFVHLFCQAVTASHFFAGMIDLLFLLSLRKYFLPTSYSLTDEVVRIDQLGLSLSRNLKYFKTYTVETKGIFLSPFDKQSRLENFRGLYLLTPAEREKILRFLERQPSLKRAYRP